MGLRQMPFFRSKKGWQMAGGGLDSSGGGGGSLPVASASTLGGVKIGDNMDIDENGVLTHKVVNYSASEQETGIKWIDGKTVYSKTINFGALPNSTTKNVAHGISNLGLVVDFSGVAFAVNGNQIAPLPYAGASEWTTEINITDTNISIKTQRDLSGLNDSYITLMYTKSN